MVSCTSMPSYEPETNDEYIEQLEAITDQQIKAETSRTYSYAGIAMLVSGVAMVAFSGKYMSGLIVSLAGTIIMTFPFIFNSEWFDWVVGIFIAFVLIYGFYFLYKFRIKKY